MAASYRSMASESSSTSNRSGWRDGGHGRMRAADLIVQCLEDGEGRYVVGVPGEEAQALCPASAGPARGSSARDSLAPAARTDPARLRSAPPPPPSRRT